MDGGCPVLTIPAVLTELPRGTRLAVQACSPRSPLVALEQRHTGGLLTDRSGATHAALK